MVPPAWENRSYQHPIDRGDEGTFQMRQSSRNLDALEVVFDDENAVANGGLVLPMTLADRLGLKEPARSASGGTRASTTRTSSRHIRRRACASP